MAVSSTTSSVTYTGNASTTAFSVPFKFMAGADLVVTETPSGGTLQTLTLGVDYTVTGAGSDAGGTLTMITAPASGASLVITRLTSPVQTTSFIAQGTFSTTIHETAFDNAAVTSQDTIRRTTSLEARMTAAEASVAGILAGPQVTGTGSQTIGLPLANYMTLSGHAAGGAVSIVVAGADTNIELDASPKGTGQFKTTNLASQGTSGVAGVSGTGGATSAAGISGVGGTPNGQGVAGTGVGNGSGVNGTGGPTGAGVSGTGGASNGRGVVGTGVGTGVGGDFFGGDTADAIHGTGGASGGYGVYGQGGANAAGGYFAPGTAASATVRKPAIIAANGDVQLGGANPNSNVAHTNTVSPKNIIKAWVTYSTNTGSAPTVLDGFNIASLALSNTSRVTVNFAQAMTNANYAVIVTGINTALTANTSNSRAAGAFEVRVFDVAGSEIAQNTSGLTVSIIIVGTQ